MSTATFGIDLASQPARTGVCMIRWNPGEPAFVDCPAVGSAPDEELLAQMLHPGVTRVGIDAPFGWPRPFVEALNGYVASNDWPGDLGDYRTNGLRLRATDMDVNARTRREVNGRVVTGLYPLSVSSDRIAVPAMRCAKLLSSYWRQSGEPADRSGGGLPVEVYPAASLRLWDLLPKDALDDPGSYKGNGETAGKRRRWVIEAIREQTRGWLEIGEKVRIECERIDDCLDSLICALTARAAELELVYPITDSALAHQEGWIALPLPDSLGHLHPVR